MGSEGIKRGGPSSREAFPHGKVEPIQFAKVARGLGTRLLRPQFPQASLTAARLPLPDVFDFILSSCIEDFHSVRSLPCRVHIRMSQHFVRG